MLVLPHRLLNQSFVQTLWSNGQSYVLKKQMSASARDRHGYLSCDAFSCVLTGQQQILSYEGPQMHINAGEVGFLPRGMYTITDLVAGETGFETVLFFIEGELVKEFLASSPDSKPSTQASSKHAPHFWKAKTSASVQNFIHEIEQGNTDGTRAKLLTLLPMMREAAADLSLLSHLHSAQYPDKKNLESFMEAHFDKPLTIADYAHLTGRSLSTFHREFRRRFGTSPRQWIKEKRLEKSYHLLAQEGSSVTDTVFAVGYQHVSHFIQAFKAKYTLTPKQMILQLREDTSRTISDSDDIQRGIPHTLP